MCSSDLNTTAETLAILYDSIRTLYNDHDYTPRFLTNAASSSGSNSNSLAHDLELELEDRTNHEDDDDWNQATICNYSKPSNLQSSSGTAPRRAAKASSAWPWYGGGRRFLASDSATMSEAVELVSSAAAVAAEQRPPTQHFCL